MGTADPRAGILRALGEPSRIRLLERLAAGPATVAELARAVDIPHYQASRHLAALEGAGVVRRTRQGRRVICALSDDPPELDLGCCRLKLGR